MSPFARQLRSKAAQLRAMADDTEALADALEAQGTTSSEPLTLKQLAERYSFTRESLRSAQAKGLPVHKGARGRVIAYAKDVDEWIRSNAWEPARPQQPKANDLDEANRLAAEALGVSA